MYNEAVDGLTKRLLKRTSSGLLYCGLERGSNQFKAEMGHLTCFLGGLLALGVLQCQVSWVILARIGSLIDIPVI